MEEKFIYSKLTQKVTVYKNLRYYSVNDNTLDMNLSDTIQCLQGEENTSVVGLEMPRYRFGEDLTTKVPYVAYKLPNDNTTYVTKCVNFAYSQNKIRMEWILGDTVTKFPGKVVCELQLKGKDYSGTEDYIYRTAKFVLEIIPTLAENMDIIEIK